MIYYFKFDFMVMIIECGFLVDCIDYQVLDEVFSNGMVIVYIGYDVIVKLLYVGYFLNIMLLCWFQKIGNKLIILMGGGIIKVGDLLFCSEECFLLDENVIMVNIGGMQCVFDCYFDYCLGDNVVVMLNNVEWFDGLNYFEFLCDIGCYFSVN